MKLCNVVFQNLVRLIMLFFHQLNDFLINQCLGLKGAGQGAVASKILVRHALHGNHVKLITHTKSGNHTSCNLGCLLNIIRCACGHRMENQFLCRASAGKGGNLILQFFLRHEEVFSLIYLHSIAQSAGSSWNNGNLVYRSGIRLQCSYQSVSYLMIGNNEFFLFR